MMDEPCHKIILDSVSENKIVRGHNTPIDFSNYILTTQYQCFRCEKGWTWSNENAHWEHCGTPEKMEMTFTGIDISECIPNPEHHPYGLPPPPNGHKFTLSNKLTGVACGYIGDEIVDGYRWMVDYYISWPSGGGGQPPFKTRLVMYCFDTGYSWGHDYFMTLIEPPCHPIENGGTINNELTCTGEFGPVFVGGEAMVEWEESPTPPPP